MYLAWSMNYFHKINRDPKKKILPRNVALGQCTFLSTCLFVLNGRSFGHFVYLCVCVCHDHSFSLHVGLILIMKLQNVFWGLLCSQFKHLFLTHGCRQSFLYCFSEWVLEACGQWPCCDRRLHCSRCASLNVNS